MPVTPDPSATAPDRGPDGRATRADPLSHLVDEPEERWSLLLLLSVFAAVFVPGVLLSAVLFASVPGGEGLARYDQLVLETAVDRRTPELSGVVSVYSDLGGPAGAIIATALAVAGLGVLWRSWTPVLLMLVAGAGSVAMSMTSKGLVGRERPPAGTSLTPLEPSFSFPSGHALNATIIAGVLAYLLLLHVRSPAARVLVVVLAVVHAVLMGLSRVYLGQHWLTDVVVGWLMAAAWLAVVLTVHRLLVRRADAAGHGAQ